MGEKGNKEDSKGNGDSGKVRMMDKENKEIAKVLAGKYKKLRKQWFAINRLYEKDKAELERTEELPDKYDRHTKQLRKLWEENQEKITEKKEELRDQIEQAKWIEKDLKSLNRRAKKISHKARKVRKWWILADNRIAVLGKAVDKREEYLEWLEGELKKTDEKIKMLME